MRRVRLLVIGALGAGLLAGCGAPTAAAAALGPTPVVHPDLWVSGDFEVAGAPVLPEDSPPDGWLCYWDVSCRPGVLAPAGLADDDPAPVAVTRVSAPVEVECRLGDWFKVHVSGRGADTGWVAANAVDVPVAARDVAECRPFVDW
jgi:hypothetical protein